MGSARTLRADTLNARVFALTLCALLPLSALAQTVDPRDLNLCGSGASPTSRFFSQPKTLKH
tara:strand:- start:359 stop:544 length:186 start_codon:yes stop_codon:yes gene_type:complete